MIVYICAPYSGDVETNMSAAKEYAFEEYERGNIPFCPHSAFSFMDEDNRSDVMEMCLEFVRLSDALHVYGRPTRGMREEIEEAESIGIPVVYMTEDV